MMQYKKDDSTRLSSHFRVSEFACRGQGCCEETWIDEKLVGILQQIRDHFGRPVYLNSGYRCQTYNQKIGGAVGSRHTKGQAADISVEGIAPAEVTKFAESIGVMGIGLYETDDDGYFVHIDTRSSRSYWYGQKEACRESFGGYGLSAFVTQLQQAIGAAADGIAGAETLGLAPTLGQHWNQRHGAVLPVQKYLAALGYTEVGPADGVAGQQFAAAVAHYQKDRGLADTGILEQWGCTWRFLLGLVKEETT